jgi:hypothetical protein
LASIRSGQVHPPRVAEHHEPHILKVDGTPFGHGVACEVAAEYAARGMAGGPGYHAGIARSRLDGAGGLAEAGGCAGGRGGDRGEPGPYVAPADREPRRPPDLGRLAC